MIHILFLFFQRYYFYKYKISIYKKILMPLSSFISYCSIKSFIQPNFKFLISLLMEVDKQQYLEACLSLVRSSKSKTQFLKNVQDFDLKYTEAYQGPAFQNKASFESFTSVQQPMQVPQRPKNPFINNFQDNFKKQYSPNSRANNFISPQQANLPYGQTGNYLINNQNKMNVPHSRSEQQFFKQQGSKTYHTGFIPKQTQKPVYNQELNNYPNRSNWQINEGIYQYMNEPQPLKPYSGEQPAQYNEMLRNFGKFNINQPQQYVNPNDLSVNSKINYNQNNSGLDSHPNQFLANLNKEDEPDFVKYYKRLVPMPNKPDNNNQRSFLQNRVNPFSNQ